MVWWCGVGWQVGEEAALAVEELRGQVEAWRSLSQVPALLPPPPHSHAAALYAGTAAIYAGTAAIYASAISMYADTISM